MTEQIEVMLKLDGWDDKAIVDRVVKALTDRLHGEMAERIKELVEALFDGAFANEADRALSAYLNTPRQKTGTYGDAMGEPVSIAEYVEERFERYMKERVDYQGRRSQYQYEDTDVRRLDWLIEECAIKGLDAVVKQAVADVREKAGAAVNAAVSKLVTEELLKMERSHDE